MSRSMPFFWQFVLWFLFSPFGTAQSYKDYVTYLSQDSKSLSVKFFKYWPEYRDYPVKFYEVHFQPNGYIVKYADAIQKEKINRNEVNNYEYSVHFNDVHYRFHDGTMFYCDLIAGSRMPLTFGIQFDLHVYHIHLLLNLGIAEAPLWDIEFSGNTFYATNSFPSLDRPFADKSRSSLSGNIFVNSSGTVTGLDIPNIYMWDENSKSASKFHWLIDYDYDLQLTNEPRIPNIITQNVPSVPGSTKQLWRLVIEDLEYKEKLDDNAFLPANVITNAIDNYYVCIDKKWYYTNHLGKLTLRDFRPSNFELVEERRSLAKKYFPILMVLLVGISAYFMVRGKKKHNE